MGETFLDRHGIKSGIKLNDVIEDFKYVYKGQEVKAGDFVNYINGVAGKTDYGESVDTQLSIEANSGYTISAVQLDGNRVFIAHSYGSNYHLYGVVCKIDGAIITYGADTQIHAVGNGGRVISTCLLPNGDVFIAHSYGANKNLYGIVCSIDGTTITKGGDIALSSTNLSGYAISTCVLPNGNVFIAHSYNDSTYLYGMVVSIDGATITTGRDTALESSAYAGHTISTCLLPNGNVFIAHSYSSSYYLYGMVVSIDGTTITKGSDTQLSSTTNTAYMKPSLALLDNGDVYISHMCNTSSESYTLYGMVVSIDGSTITHGTDTVIDTTAYSGKYSIAIKISDNKVLVIHSSNSYDYMVGVIVSVNGTTITKGTQVELNSAVQCLTRAMSFVQFENGTIFVAHRYDSSSYLYAQIFGIDYDNNIPTTNIVITEYEQQVTPAIEPPFNAVALSDGVGAPEFVEGEVEVTKTGNIFPTSWNEEVAYTKYSSNGWILEASGVASNNAPYYSVDRISDTLENTSWSYKESGTTHSVTMSCPVPTKITKMKTKISGNWAYYKSLYIQGYKTGGSWVNLGTADDSTADIALNNTDYYEQYRLLLTLTSAQLGLYFYNWETVEYVEKEIQQIPSTEHNEQVKIAKSGKLLSSLPVGTLVKDVNSTFLGEPIVWKIADKNHEGYPDNSVTLIADRSIAMRAFDTEEPNNTSNGKYSLSNIRQWLNSDAEAGQWYSAQHDTDLPPTSEYMDYNAYADDVGFLNGFSEKFKNSLLDTDLLVFLNSASTTNTESETVTDKIFLASKTEVGFTLGNGLSEGTLLSVFNDKNSRVAYCTAEAITNSNHHDKPDNDTTGWYWWLRTNNYNNHVSFVNDDGAQSLFSPYSSYIGVRPLCNISSLTRVSKTVDEDGCYTLFAGGEA